MNTLRAVLSLTLLLLLATACSGGNGGGGKGGGDPEIETVSVSLVLTTPYSTPANRLFAVNDALGDVFAIGRSDSAGNAQIEVPVGGSISVFDSYQFSFTRHVVVEPPEGSTIHLELFWGYSNPDPIIPPEATNYSITLTAPVGGVTSYRFLSGCGGNDSGAGLAHATDNVPCPARPKTDFPFVGFDAGGVAQSWGGQFDVASSPGGTVNLSIPVSNTDFANIGVQTLGGFGFGEWRADVQPFDDEGHQLISYIETAGANGEPFVGEIRVPQSQSDRILVSQQVGADGSGGSSSLSHYAVVGPQSTTVTFDAGTVAPAVVSVPDYSDPERVALTWGRGDGALGDAIWLIVQNYSGVSSHYTYIHVPPDHPGYFAIPAVPEEAAIWALYPNPEQSSSTIIATEVAGIDGYADFLSSPFVSFGFSTYEQPIGFEAWQAVTSAYTAP